MPNKKNAGTKISDNKKKDTENNKESEGKGKEYIFVAIKREIFKKHDIRYDVMDNTFQSKLKKETVYKPLNKNDLLCELMELGYSRVSEKVNILLGSSNITRYHPIKSYLNNLPKWDGKPYFNKLAGCVTTKDQPYFEKHLRKYLINVVAAGLGKIKFNKHILTLAGGQNSGKTSFLRFLVPKSLKKYYSEDIDFSNKEGRIALSENWFICLDEFDSIPYRDIPKIKKFTSTEVVKARRVYGTNNERMYRVSNFTATVNKEEFLQDETGNVRWLIHEVDSIKHDFGGKDGYEANIDMDKVYSEIKHLVLNEKVPISFSNNEIQEINKTNSKYMISMLLEDYVLREFRLPTENDKDDNKEYVSNDVILSSCIGIPERVTPTKIGRVMKKLGFKKVSRRLDGSPHPRKLYEVVRIGKK